MADVVKFPQTSHKYYVAWKLKSPDLPVRNGALNAHSVFDLAQLLDNLYGITMETVESVYVHKVVPDGVQELIAYDQTDAPNLNTHFLRKKPGVPTASEKLDEGEDEIDDGAIDILDQVKDAIESAKALVVVDAKEEKKQEVYPIPDRFGAIPSPVSGEAFK